jgi:hypothetical protein
MKKTLRLILLAVAAVVLLTSCDAMLESLFPRDTIGDTAVDTPANNTITFKITGYDNDYYVYPVGYWGYNGYYRTLYALQFIYVEIYDQQNALVANSYTWFNETWFGGDFGARTVSDVTFTGLEDGNYTFKVWYDVDGDGYSTLEANYTGGYYYTYYDNSYNTNLYVSGDTTRTADVTLYEHYTSY